MMRTKSYKLQSKETLLFRYPEPSRLAIDVGVCYPSNYRTGMSNLALHFLYDTLRRKHELRVKRVFLDSNPYTIEGKKPVSTLSVLFFTVSYEEDYFNLVKMLYAAGIEPLREKRGHEQIIIVGGPPITANPLPMFPVADVIVLGEGEGVLDEIADSLTAEGPGEDFLDDISRIPSVIIPGTGMIQGKRRAVTTSDRFSKTVIVTPDTTFSNTFLVEIGRGCRSRCNFCLARGIYGRFRYASLDWIEELAAELPENVSVGLVSTAVLAHPRFMDIVSLFSGKGTRVTVSSIRAEDIDKEKAELLAASGLRSAALAPESGSDRVRFALGKMVRNDVYIEAVKVLSNAGIRRLSLYMLVGFGLDDGGTFLETRDFLRGIKAVSRGARITIHANVLVPKPATPFQFLPFSEETRIKDSIRMLNDAALEAGVSVKFKSMRSAERQAVLSLGDERVGRAVVLSVVEGLAWKKALQVSGVDRRFIYEEKGIDTEFPWDGILGPAAKENLFRRFVKSVGRKVQ